MKKTIFVGLTIILCLNVFGQDNKLDSAVIEFIKSQKEFVGVVDTINLPAIVKPYYKSILDYLTENKLNKKLYYISVNYIQDKSESISIPLYHFNGFKKQLELENKDKEYNEKRPKGEYPRTTNMVGNASGKDGNLEIEKKTQKIIGFTFWQ